MLFAQQRSAYGIDGLRPWRVLWQDPADEAQYGAIMTQALLPASYSCLCLFNSWQVISCSIYVTYPGHAVVMPLSSLAMAHA